MKDSIVKISHPCFFKSNILRFFFTSLFCLLTCTLLLSSCAEEEGPVPPPSEHTHTFNTVVTLAPSCEASGLLENKCDCGAVSGSATEIAPLGHDFQNGLCTRCGHQTSTQINKLEFVVDGTVVSEYSKAVYSAPFQVSLRINGNDVAANSEAFTVVWGFSGNDYESTVSQNGLVTLGNFLGSVTLSVRVTSENEVCATLPITVVPGDLNLTALSVSTKEGHIHSYKEGDVFDTSAISVWGEHKAGILRIYNFKASEIPLKPTDTDFTVSYGNLSTDLPITVSPYALQSIEIANAPGTTTYLEGQPFNKTGLLIKAVLENTSMLVADFEVDEITPLALGTTEVVISYTRNGVTKTVTQAITVLPRALLSVTVNTSSVRKVYTRGDTFNPAGITILATYEGLDRAVSIDFTYSSAPLSTEDHFVDIHYTVDGVPNTERIDITVARPYEKIAQVKVLSPADISIIWMYSYLTEENERIIDNTAYTENDLRHDKVNGIYDIPMGAIVTATIKNPAVINVSLNGSVQVMNYIEKTITWTMGEANLVVIESIETATPHTVIRFASQENEQSFLYEASWNGYLSEDDLTRLSLIFTDTNEFYYTYLIDGELFRFQDLPSVAFTAETSVIVMKNTVTSDSKEIVLHLFNNIAYSIYLTDTAKVSDLPVFTRLGYEYAGWALTENGESIDDTALEELLSQAETSCHLYVRWIKETVDYSDKFLHPDSDSPTYDPDLDPGIQFAGSWAYQFSNGTDNWDLIITFNKDGTFSYVVAQNGNNIAFYSGNYRIAEGEDMVIAVISVETEMEIPLPHADDFKFAVKKDATLTANLIVVSGQSLVFTLCEEITKVS